MTHINFTGNLKKYLGVSLAVMAVILVCAFVFQIQLDIQFKGGSIITYAYEGTINKDEFERVAQELTATTISIQQSTDLATGMETMVLSLPGSQSLTSQQLIDLNEGLSAAFPQNNPHTVEISNVDATIGRAFLAKCLTAVALASILMVAYTAWRFRRIGGLSAGVMAVIALVHDIIIVFGVFVIFRIPLNDNFIAVVLTILGYSINDTIVVYDRIRENKRLMGSKASIGELVNTSINQSFRRSMNTTITTMLAMIVVTVVARVYGVESIITFAFPMLLGLLSGTYSSICIAGPLWVKWQERKLANSQ
jgi:preprotein translocase SecF subunit